jgi:PAS domain S-box-containing protein
MSAPFDRPPTGSAAEPAVSAQTRRKPRRGLPLLPPQLRLRLVTSIAVVVAVCVLVSACYQANQAADVALDWLQDDATDVARAYADAVLADSRNVPALVWSDQRLPPVKTAGMLWLEIIDANGQAVGTQTFPEALRRRAPSVAPPPDRPRDGPRVHVEYEPALHIGGMQLLQRPRWLSAAYPIGTNARQGWVVLASSAYAVDQMRERTFVKAAETGILTLGACVLIVILMIRRPLRELEAATAFVSRLSSQAGASFPVSGTTLEIQQLSAAINWASMRLQEQQRALQSSEAHKRDLLDNLHEVVFEVDLQGRWAYLNPAWTQITGFDLARSLNQPFERHVAEEDLPRVRPLIAAVLSDQESRCSVVLRIATHDRGLRWLEVNMKARRDDTGRINGLVGTLIDLTERENAERRLRDQLRFTEELLDAIPIPVFHRASDGRLLGINRAHRELFGYAADTLVGQLPEQSMPAEVAKAHTRGDEERTRIGAIQTYDTQAPDVNGQLRQLLCTKAPFHTADGKTAGMIGVFLDITDRKRAEQDIAQAKEFLHRIIDAVPGPIFVSDAEQRLVLVNDAWLDMTGLSRSEAIGKTPSELSPAVRELASGSEQSIEEKLVHDEATAIDGKARLHRVIRRMSGFSMPDGRRYVMGVISDVTEISRAKADVEAQLRFTRELIEALPFPVFVKDRTGRYILVNRRMEEFAGVDREQMLGRRVEQVQPEDVARAHQEADASILQGGAVSYETPYYRSDGERREAVLTKSGFTNPDGSFAGIICTVTDVTERRRIERNLNVQYEIARVLADAASVGEAASRILHIVGTSLKYRVGAFWEVDAAQQALQCRCTWSVSEDGHEQPDVLAGNERLAKGMHLPGRIWASGKPERAAEAHPAPLDTGFGFPIQIGGEVLAVMHFVGKGMDASQASLVSMLEAAGNQIGQFMQRSRIEDSLRASEAAARKLSLVASHTTNAVLITDTLGRIEWVNRGFTTMTGYEAEDAVGEPLERLLHGPETEPTTTEFMLRRMQERRGFTAELVQHRRTTEKYWVSIEMQPVFSEAGDLTNFIAIQTDITERKLGEQALVEANIRLNLTLEGANLALYDWDVKSGVVYMSDVWSTMLGGPKTDTVTTLPDLARIIHPDSIAAMRAEVVPMLKGIADSYGCVQRVRALDGEWRWIYTHGKVVERDAAGRATRVFGVNTDVTKREQAELALRQSEERYNLAVNGSNDGIWDLDIAGQTFYLSPRFAGLLHGAGDAAVDVIERWHCLFHPDDRDAERDALERHLQHGEPYEVELRMSTANGGFRWFRVRGKAVLDQQGRAHRIAGSITDTHDYRLAREQLEETRDRLDSILRSATDMIWSRSTDLRTLIYINPAVRELYGREPEEFYANPYLWVDAVHTSDRARVLTAMTQILETGAVEMEFRVLRPDGTTAWVNERSSIARNATGEPIRIDAISSDITERKMREAELETAKEAAEAATRSKSEFLANMSHEIRTPMNGIIGIADLALNGKLSAEQREYIGMVRSSANALLELINDILDFSKIEAGLLHFERTEFLLRETLADSVKLLALRAEEKNLELIWRVEPNVPEVLLGDPLRLRQVITNLLSNAVKFTEHGEVELCVGLSERDRDEAQLLFAIRDTGIGIPQDKIETVFQPFSQADMSTTRKYGGTGLGLTICERLVRMMGGSMSVRSNPGQGSTFFFTASFGVAAVTPEHYEAAVDLRGVRALLCDDNAAQLVAMSEPLDQWHMMWRAADDLNEALGILDAAAGAGKPFEVAIFDAGLTGGDSKRLVQRVRARGSLQDLPIILLMPVTAARGKNRGGTGTRVSRINKPFSHTEFKQAIAAALGRGVAVRPAAATASAPARNLHILLVEDNEINIRFARGILERMGHTITVARNGLEAVQAVGAQAEAPFDLVLMDMQMPVMSGLEATGAIRILERGTQHHLPIIAMTANAMRGDRERCLEAGMDEYISKPVAVPKLVETIERLLTRSAESPASAAASPAGSPLLPAPVSSLERTSATAHTGATATIFDRVSVIETLGGDEAAFCELASMFFDDHKAMLEQARQALAADDMEQLAAVSHTLKGMIGNFAAPPASRAALALYQAAHKGERDKSQKALRRLEKKLVELAEALASDPAIIAEIDAGPA